MAVLIPTPRPSPPTNTAQKHNAGQVRTDDYSIIGAALGMLLTPAIFLKRAPLIQLVAGGAALGLGGGVWVHLFKSLAKGEEIKPEGMVSSGLLRWRRRGVGLGEGIASIPQALL